MTDDASRIKSARADMLGAALAYAARGWPVFPLWWPAVTGPRARCACGVPACKNVGKHPHGKLAPRGLKSATTDASVIRAWWGAAPEANVGIVLGEVAGMFAIDVDPRHGGDRTLVECVRDQGPIGDTLHAHTGAGGDHYLFCWPGRPVSGSAHKLGPGLDVKGDGGYIVAAPSLHASGLRYAWERHDAAPLAAPPWMLARIHPPPPAAVVSPPRSPLPSLGAYKALDVLVRECAFIEHAATAPTSLSYEEWFGLATVLRVFPAGDYLFDEISRRDPKRYNSREVKRKLDTIRGAPRHCSSLGWSCPRLGRCRDLGVQSPAGLPYKLLKSRRNPTA